VTCLPGTAGPEAHSKMMVERNPQARSLERRQQLVDGEVIRHGYVWQPKACRTDCLGAEGRGV
jgi:hypothetical protein